MTPISTSGRPRVGCSKGTSLTARGVSCSLIRLDSGAALMVGFAEVVGVVQLLHLSLMMQRRECRLFVAVRRVLDQLALGLLKALGLSASALRDRSPRRIGDLIGDAPADVRRFGFGEPHLLLVLELVAAPVIRRKRTHGSPLPVRANDKNESAPGRIAFEEGVRQ